jgi:hypothetical protein
MRRFMTLLVTEIDFVDGDQVSDAIVQGYEQHLATAVQDASKKLSLRTVKGNQVVKVQVAEIKGLLSL